MVRPIPKTRLLASRSNLLIQYITVYTPSLVHLNQIAPSTTTTVPLVAIFCPPHNVASIQRTLRTLEDLSKPDKALIVAPFSSPAPKEDSARCSFWARPVRTRSDRIGCRVGVEV